MEFSQVEQQIATDRLLKDLFGQVFTLLKNEAGAPENMRQGFVEYHAGRHAPDMRSCGSTTEWRFMGKLGMGGKFWVSLDEFFVACYSEDRTPERQELIGKINKLLVPYYTQWRNICWPDE